MAALEELPSAAGSLLLKEHQHLALSALENLQKGTQIRWRRQPGVEAETPQCPEPPADPAVPGSFLRGDPPLVAAPASNAGAATPDHPVGGFPSYHNPTSA